MSSRAPREELSQEGDNQWEEGWPGPVPPTASCTRTHGWMDWGPHLEGGQALHGFEVT